MHTPTPAGARRRTSRAILAAALPALAAIGMPAAAQADTIAVVKSNNRLGYFTTQPQLNENNDITLRVVGDEIVITDVVPVIAGNGCRVFNGREARCPASVAGVDVSAFNGNDRVEYQLPHDGFVDLGAGVDTLVAGKRAAAGRAIQPVIYLGGPDSDAVSYKDASSAVRIEMGNNAVEDGRPGIDREHVGGDFEILEGSSFNDQLFGSLGNDVIRGLNGADTIGGGEGADLIDEGTGLNGADIINGGNGAQDTVTYSQRTAGVNVSLDGVRNDGLRGDNNGFPGELDDVRPSVEHVIGTNLADTLIGNGSANAIHGLGGADTIEGRDGNDTLTGGADADAIRGEGGNDVTFARDGVQDTVTCSSGVDTVTADLSAPTDLMTGCENVSVGRLHLTPQAVNTEAGKPARLRLSWRHPRGWRELRKIELRLLDDGAPVGEVTFRPRTGAISADGGVQLVHKATRLSRQGKTVIARLALRLDKSLAGQRLTAAVEATDTRGARQLETDAGAISVAR
jgi:RTX calcium-binding nonapeptide repeat (4 copies)